MLKNQEQAWILCDIEWLAESLCSYLNFLSEFINKLVKVQKQDDAEFAKAQFGAKMFDLFLCKAVKITHIDFEKILSIL